MNDNIKLTWGVLSSLLENYFKFDEIKEIVGLAGLDRTLFSHMEQKSNFRGSSKGQLINEIDKNIQEFSDDKFKHFVNIVIEEILERNKKRNIRKNKDLKSELDKYLNRLGWQLDNNQIIPIEILDLSNLKELHPKSHEDLKKASIRFRDGDLNGALTSACSSVDSVTNEIYIQEKLGDPGKASFQEKCKKSIEAAGVISNIKNELLNIGWTETHANMLIKNLNGSLNQIAFVMQKLRTEMSDVHGSKEVLKPLVFDSIKYAQILIRMMTR